jgi:hypothetical protein
MIAENSPSPIALLDQLLKDVYEDALAGRVVEVPNKFLQTNIFLVRKTVSCHPNVSEPYEQLPILQLLPCIRGTSASQFWILNYCHFGGYRGQF